jgi:hypothetical protein
MRDARRRWVRPWAQFYRASAAPLLGDDAQTMRKDAILDGPATGGDSDHGQS